MEENRYFLYLIEKVNSMYNSIGWPFLNTYVGGENLDDSINLEILQ